MTPSFNIDSDRIRQKLLSVLIIGAGLAAAFMAELPESNARYVIGALSATILFFSIQRKSGPGRGTLLLWALLATTAALPFLPGMGGAYPPTRFLLVPATGAFFAGMKRWGPGRLRAWQCFLLMLWLTIIGARSYEIYKRLGYGYDLAHVLNILTNTLKGKFLYSDYTAGSILSHHLYLTLALLAPARYFISSPFLPQAIQIVLMGASCLLLAFGASRRYGQDAGVAVFFSFLMHPAFQGQILHEMDPGVIGLFATACAIYGYCADYDFIFWAGVVGAILSKEHFAVAAIIAGITFLKNPNERRRGTVLVASGIVVLASFAAYSIMFGGPLNLATQFAIRYGEHPGAAALLEPLRPGKLGYLLHMLLPSGGLAVLAWPELLPALPEIMINMTSRFPMHHLSTHYSLLSLPFLALATGRVVGYLTSKNGDKDGKGRWAAKYIITCSVAAAIFSNLGPLSHSGAFYDVLNSDRDWSYRYLDALVARMPSGSVAVRGGHRLLIYFADRSPAINLPYIDTSKMMASRDLLVLDQADDTSPPGYTLIDSEGRTYVYQKMK